MGAKSVAAMVAVTGALNMCVLWGNMGPEGDALIRDAVRGKAKERLALSCACEIMESAF